MTANVSENVMASFLAAQLACNASIVALSHNGFSSL